MEILNSQKVAFFQSELENITSEGLRECARDLLTERNAIPDYYWTIGASSSGKYHPKISQGEGGLIRHVKIAMMFLEDILRMSSFAYMTDEMKDYARFALLFHDCVKYGWANDEINKNEYANHARNGARLVNQWWNEYFGDDAPYLLMNAMRSHMGQWSTEKEDRPFTQIDRAVHLADYMSSRAFVDVPAVSDLYNEIFCETDLPF